jgi:hypothetical protein
MRTRHAVFGRIRPKGLTPLRIAAANRALARERNSLPLFAKQVASEQPTPEERIEHADITLLQYQHAHRDLAARHWRLARRMLANVAPELQEALLSKWNQSTVPPHAHYFADFVRTELKRSDTSLQPLA